MNSGSARRLFPHHNSHTLSVYFHLLAWVRRVRLESIAISVLKRLVKVPTVLFTKPKIRPMVTWLLSRRSVSRTKMRVSPVQLFVKSPSWENLSTPTLSRKCLQHQWGPSHDNRLLQHSTRSHLHQMRVTHLFGSYMLCPARASIHISTFLTSSDPQFERCLPSREQAISRFRISWSRFEEVYGLCVLPWPSPHQGKSCREVQSILFLNWYIYRIILKYMLFWMIIIRKATHTYLDMTTIPRNYLNGSFLYIPLPVLPLPTPQGCRLLPRPPCPPPWFKAPEPPHWSWWYFETCRFRSCPLLRYSRTHIHSRSRHPLVPCAWDPSRLQALLYTHRCLVYWLHLRRNGQPHAPLRWWLGNWSII